jgi:hypothetical protein
VIRFGNRMSQSISRVRLRDHPSERRIRNVCVDLSRCEARVTQAALHIPGIYARFNPGQIAFISQNQ